MLQAARLWSGHEARSVTFENPTGRRGAGGTANRGRKGDPARMIHPGETVPLVEMAGPGMLTHVWMTVGSGTRVPAEPRLLRALQVDIRYDGLACPSVSVPLSDFFGLAHGFATPYWSILTSSPEGSGFASRIPMPFRENLSMSLSNHGDSDASLFYQADLLLGPVPADTGYLHAEFRRENPTQAARDFVITDGLRGPGRFLGMVAGARLLSHRQFWWGDGEVKMYFDGEEQPTICGTGTEDYLDTGWGLGSFCAPETGVPLLLGADEANTAGGHEYVGFYRWHLTDPVPFRESIKVTLQQMGHGAFAAGDEAAFAEFRREHLPAGREWAEYELSGEMLFFGLYERRDDWSATSFVYCAQPQAVPTLDVAAAVADLPDDVSGLRPVRRTGPISLG
jgi:hypothetical protein